jgi:hypothetical protein
LFFLYFYIYYIVVLSVVDIIRLALGVIVTEVSFKKLYATRWACLYINMFMCLSSIGKIFNNYFLFCFCFMVVLFHNRRDTMGEIENMVCDWFGLPFTEILVLYACA